MTDENRKAFEEWFSMEVLGVDWPFATDIGCFETDDDGKYNRNCDVIEKFEAWQAATAAANARVKWPDKRKRLLKASGSGKVVETELFSEWNEALDEFAKLNPQLKRDK